MCVAAVLIIFAIKIFNGSRKSASPVVESVSATQNPQPSALSTETPVAVASNDSATTDSVAPETEAALNKFGLSASSVAPVGVTGKLKPVQAQ